MFLNLYGILTKNIFSNFVKIFSNPKRKLKPLTLGESKKKCSEVNASSSEIRAARKSVSYTCERCGYHSGIIRRCPVCGGWMRYWQLYERILENRK